MPAKSSSHFCLILLLALLSVMFDTRIAKATPTVGQLSADAMYDAFLKLCVKPVMHGEPVAMMARDNLVEFSSLQAMPFLNYRRGLAFLLPLKPTPAVLVVPDDDSCEIVSLSVDDTAFWKGFQFLFKSEDVPFSSEKVETERPGYRTEMLHGFFENVMLKVTVSGPLPGKTGSYKLAVITLPKSTLFQTPKK